MENNLGQVVLVKDINPGSSSSYLGSFTESNGKLYFSANDGENGKELWVTDGTAEGTQLVADINPGSNSSSPDNLIELNDKLYFSADDGVNGDELWVSDGLPSNGGTAESTQLVADINPGSNSSGLSYLTEFNDKLYFSANDGENGSELWVSDGTTEGTQLLADIGPNDKYYFDQRFGNFYYVPGSYPRDLTEFNGKLYFSANDDENGNELWVSDGLPSNGGTTEGTQLFIDIDPGRSGSYPRDLTEVNGKLYFAADDGESGDELWVSDGTAEGTQLVAEIDISSLSSNPSDLTEFGGKLYFSADDGENGRELWVSDGTAEGTQLVTDINPGFDDFDYSYAYASSNPRDLTEFNGKLYFSADDGENGEELWVSDGTTAGAQLAADINPGSDDSFPRNLFVFEDELYFNADNGETGDELFKLTLNDSHEPEEPDPINVITGTDGKDSLVGTDVSDDIQGLKGKDNLDGGEGNDTLDGGDDKDELFGGAGDDSLIGGDKKDTLDGGDGNDTLLGGNDKDYLVGGAGDDSLVGADKKDTLYGGAGYDILTGGDDKDLFVIESGEGSDTITDFELGRDKLGLAGGLVFDDLHFDGNTIQSGDETLATLTDVDTASLTERDFEIF